MLKSKKSISIVGAGLAGSECAYQLAEMGYSIKLFEMRDKTKTPAHKTNLFAELVCSNSLGSQTHYSAPGQLKWEAQHLGSLILKAAEKAKVPAGMALGVDRNIFSETITKTLQEHKNISIVNEVFTDLDSIDLNNPTILATGPLTHYQLADSLCQHFENKFLYFFDAIAPIIDAESINQEITWKANRFQEDVEGDYINCPLNKQQYRELIEAIKLAPKVEPKEFEQVQYFDGCMPIEAIIERGDETLRFGPMSPKGLINPRTGQKEYAVVQLRQENKQATSYNMVGFQTKMTYKSQKEILRKIPGLENADFLKLGSIHKNLYIHSPKMLTPQLQSKRNPYLFFAGQITGVEGYFESACTGLMVAYFMDSFLSNKIFKWPQNSAFCSLINAITEEKEHFQPTNINFSLFPPLQEQDLNDSVYQHTEFSKDTLTNDKISKILGGRKNKKQRRELQIARAKESFLNFMKSSFK